MSWIAWLVAAAALGAAEFFTLTLAFGILGGAALVAAVVAGLGAGWVIQIFVFAATAGAGLLVARPIARRQLTQPPAMRDGSDALVGKRALVLEEITADSGLVKLAGEHWSARCFDESQVIPAGAAVDVMEIEGATAIVYSHEPLP